MADGTRGRTVRACGWATTASVGSVLVTQALGWDGTTSVAVLQAVTPIGLVAVVAVTCLAALGRAWALTITSAAVVLGLLLLAMPLALAPEPTEAVDGATGLSVASINLLFDNRSVADLADDLVERDPDVVAFSEYAERHRRRLDRHPLTDRYPHRIDLDRDFGSGLALWSKFPVLERGPNITDTRGITVTIDGPDGPVRVVAVHPRTPITDFDGWLESLDGVGDVATGDVAENASGPPTLVVGDFNASYWHPAYRRLLDRGLTDAHIATGRGWSTSWPLGRSIPPFVRLDHALTDDRLTVVDLVDFDPAGSDHRGFVVTVAPAVLSPER